MSAPKVSRQDIRRIISDNFNGTDIRFSNDEILEHLNEDGKYKAMSLDVLDFEDVLLEMEQTGFLRPIAQNFNTRYYKVNEAYIDIIKTWGSNNDKANEQ
jgi:hypothetical protein